MQVEPGRFLAWPIEADPGHLPSLIRESSELPAHRGALAHWEVLAARAACDGELSLALEAPVARALRAHGIERLYTHQVHAIEALRASLDTVVVTGTASGKSLCYHVPVLERLLG